MSRVRVRDYLAPLPLDPHQVSIVGGFQVNALDDEGIPAHEFLTYAWRDLAQGDNHGLVNALSNAKRAIDQQVNTILRALRQRPHRLVFPEKLKALEECGVTTPGILRRLNRTRNELEHAFSLPERERVEDAVDTAWLFLKATSELAQVSDVEIEFRQRLSGGASPWCVVNFGISLRDGEGTISWRVGKQFSETELLIMIDEPGSRPILRAGVLAAEFGGPDVWENFRSLDVALESRPRNVSEPRRMMAEYEDRNLLGSPEGKEAS
jgi:hypothetical protein